MATTATAPNSTTRELERRYRAILADMAQNLETQDARRAFCDTVMVDGFGEALRYAGKVAFQAAYTRRLGGGVQYNQEKLGLELEAGNDPPMANLRLWLEAVHRSARHDLLDRNLWAPQTPGAVGVLRAHAEAEVCADLVARTKRLLTQYWGPAAGQVSE